MYSSQSSDWLEVEVLLLVLIAFPAIIMCINDNDDVDGTTGFSVKLDT